MLGIVLYGVVITHKISEAEYTSFVRSKGKGKS
jgi:hypothetical protein